MIFRINRINLVPLPSQSPDINNIEKLWFEVIENEYVAGTRSKE